PSSSSSGVATPRDPSPVKSPPERTKKINNGWYLGIILGHNIDLTMSSSERFHFKKDYENFKVRVTATMFAALCYASVFPSRAADAVCIFLAVWYYCTLTIRESILILNGSSIHWWWVAHHYLAAALAGVVVTWPEDEAYQEFRPQLGIFSMYICVVQQLQYQYQSGCLRRLHALGSLRSEMDVTLEGFASWMFHGLTFLLPFLLVAYLFELYNSVTLFKMWWSREQCAWQVMGLSALLATVGVGNLIMVSGIVYQKISETPSERKQSLKSNPRLIAFLLQPHSMPATTRRTATPTPPPRVRGGHTDTPRPLRRSSRSVVLRAAAAATAPQPAAAPVVAPAAVAPPPPAAADAVNVVVDEEAPTCAVCMDALDTKRVLTLLPCAHRLHRTCVLQWLETRCCAETHNCPLCRARVRNAQDDAGGLMTVRAFGESGQ
ncbi:hypothetical protein PENTCL1PPCAC_9776, partial [Pristionchus entomophagus]